MSCLQVIFKLKKRFVGIVVFFLIVLLLLISLPVFQCFSQEQVEIKDLISFEHIDYVDGIWNRVFADFDLDGIDEFINQGHDTKGNRAGMLLIDFDNGIPLTSVWHAAAAIECEEAQALDFIGDPAPEVFLPVKKGNKTWMQVYENVHGFGETGYTLLLQTESVSGKDINGDGVWDGMMRFCRLMDLNADEQKDILTSVCTGYDRNPRGLLAFDGKSGEKLWHFLTAPHVYDIHTVDINQDGVEEILFATDAPCNGNIINDMDDCHSYLVCLSRNGQLLWKKEMSGVFIETRYACADIDEDSEIEIVCTYATGDKPDKSTQYELQIRDAPTGEVEKYRRVSTRFSQPFLADLDRDGKNDIVVTNANRTISVLDAELNVKNQVVLPGRFQACGICQIEDINQDGEQEIIAGSANNILIFDSGLRLLGTYLTNRKVRKVHFSRHALYRGLLSVIEGSSPCEDALLLDVGFKTGAEKAFASVTKFGVVSLFVIFVLGIMLSFLVLRIIPPLWEKTRSSGVQKIEQGRNALLETLSVFGHGKIPTANLDRLSLLFKNLPKDQLPSIEYGKKIDEAVMTYFDFTSGRLFEINKKSKLAEINREHREHLEKSLKKLESLLTDYKTKGIQQSQVEEFSKGIPMTAESLEENIESLWKELARYFSCDTIAVVQEVLAAISVDMKNEKVELKNFYVEGDVGAKGFIGRSDFATVLEELVSNAIYSMKKSLKKEIIIKISLGKRKILVEVSDTGCGMKEEDFEKIFDREYSTKKEGGFGLYHAKATLNKYGGKIKVIRSELGGGTTVQIELRTI